MSGPTYPSTRALRIWLLIFNFALMAIGAALVAAGARRALFVVALVPVAFAPFAYARLRLHRELGRLLDARRMAWITGVGMALDAVMAAQLLTARAAHAAAWVSGPALSWIGPVWFSAHALLFLGYTVIGLGRILRRVLRRVLVRPLPAIVPAAGAPAIGRREFLRQYGVVGAAAPFAISLSGVGVSYDFRVDEHEIELPHWPRALDGLRVAHLSDIHVGGAMDRRRLRDVAALTNAARPDLVVHTGDFLTHRSGDFDAPLYEALASIETPYGQWACLGNHDFDDPERLTRKLGHAGVTVLRDRIATLDLRGQPLEIAGLDYFFRRADRDELTRRMVSAWQPRQVPRLLLNHDPRGFAALPDGCADLVLSGHTHGGHIGIQLGAGHAITVVGLAGIPDQGVFRRGDMRMFVTRCVGFYGYPMRVGIPPEIALLVLRAPRTQGALALSAGAGGNNGLL
jgi:predicted MPP superfamily phosphohydrolase